MNGFLIVNGLMVAFTLAILVGALWAVLRLRQRAPIIMRRRLDREVALRLDAMDVIASTYATAGTRLRDTLALNYRFHRAAVLALDPGAQVAPLEQRVAGEPRTIARAA